MRIAINGMGRIGRLLLRRLAGHPLIKVVAINDIMPPENLFYLLKYDSVYGTYSGKIVMNGENILVNDQSIRIIQNANPSALPWKELDIDMVLECTGKFTDKTSAQQHLEAGAKKVLLSTTGSDDIPLMIYGHNHTSLVNEVNIISPGGCMTNCSVHIMYILNAIGIESAHLNILHSYTSRQELVDAPHKDFRRGRAAAESIIPVEIDLHHSLERLMPGMKNKIAAVSTRVPVANGAMADYTIQLSNDSTIDVVNGLFEKAAMNEYEGILEFSMDPLVSVDIKGNTHSCIIDGRLTSIVGKQLKVIAWFDNEFGFTSRMIDWIIYWNKLLI